MRILIELHYHRDAAPFVTVRVDGSEITTNPLSVEEAADGWTIETHVADVEVAMPMKLPAPRSSAKTHARPKRAEWNAAQGVGPTVKSSAGRVLQAFVDHYHQGGAGMTSFEVANRLNMNLYTAAPRCTDLERGGWLLDTGELGPSAGGAGATRYRLSTAAIHTLHLAPPPGGEQRDLIEEIAHAIKD